MRWVLLDLPEVAPRLDVGAAARRGAVSVLAPRTGRPSVDH